MKSWYRTIREDELKDGSIRKVYHLVFETDDKGIVETIEHFFYDVMDAKTENSSEKPNNCDDCKWSMQNCHDIEVCCEDETGECVGYEPKDELQTERSDEK